MFPRTRAAPILAATLALVLALAGRGVAEAARPYSVDDLLRLEDIGKVRFTPDGRRLLFERYGRFDGQSDYGRGWVIGELRSRILQVDLDRPGAPRPLMPQADTDGYALWGVSPDGRRAAYGRLSARGLHPGLVDLAGGAPHELATTAPAPAERDTPWIGDQVLLRTLAPGRFDLGASLRAEMVDSVVARWRQMRAGQVETAEAMGSGRYADFPGLGGSLVVAGDRKTPRALLAGVFTEAFVAPDGRRIAALREERLTPDPAQPLEHGANIGGVQRRLEIVAAADGAADGGPALDPCPGCDVLRSSVNWSPSGRRLAFYARPPGQAWSAARFYVWAVGQSRATPVGLGDQAAPHVGRVAGLWLDVRSAWIGEELAVLVDRATEAARDRNSRADWRLLSATGSAQDLTTALPGETPSLVATAPDGLVLLQAGRAWFVSPGRPPRRLAADLPASLHEWREPSPYGEQAHLDLQPQSHVAFLELREDGAPAAVVFVDLASGAGVRVALPASARKVVAVAPVVQRVATLLDDHNATVLAVVGADGASRDVAEVNTHLKTVAAARPVRIDHKGPSGDLRHSWLLLPADWRPGQRLATIVNVYPGSAGGETYRNWRPDTLNALNDEVLVGRGYAVLYPSLPQDYEKTPRDPIKDLTAEVFAAVDAAAAQGYVDPARLAVQGQSYGGYATAALISQSDRFRTAVAQAGLYDLVSDYGTFDARLRVQAPYTGLDLFSASWAETSQGGMGAPPWQDPERYLRNSPLMHVAAIHTPVLLMNGDLDYVPTSQSEELFTALTRLGKDAVYVRFYGEDHVFHSPANIREMWRRIFDWYGQTLGPPTPAGGAAPGPSVR